MPARRPCRSCSAWCGGDHKRARIMRSRCVTPCRLYAARLRSAARFFPSSASSQTWCRSWRWTAPSATLSSSSPTTPLPCMRWIRTSRCDQRLDSRRAGPALTRPLAALQGRAGPGLPALRVRAAAGARPQCGTIHHDATRHRHSLRWVLEPGADDDAARVRLVSCPRTSCLASRCCSSLAPHSLRRPTAPLARPQRAGAAAGREPRRRPSLPKPARRRAPSAAARRAHAQARAAGTRAAAGAARPLRAPRAGTPARGRSQGGCR